MRSKMMISLLALCALLVITPAQGGLQPGRCPDRAVISPIDLSKYAGRWYEISSFGAFFEFNGKCIQAVYTPQSDGSIEVVNMKVDKTSLEISSIKGNAVREDDSGAGKLKVTFPVAGWMNRTGSYYILDTDYDNYALVYSCRDLFIARYDFGWILSRKPTLDEKYKENINKILTENKLTPSDYAETVQDCGAIDCSEKPCKFVPSTN